MRRHRHRRLLRHGVPLSLPKCAAAASRTRATTVRHRRDCFLEWKLRLLPLLHSVVLAAARRCSLGAMILRGQTVVVVVVVTVSLVAVDFLFWTPESERASELARPSTVRLLHCTPLLPPLSLPSLPAKQHCLSIGA